MKFTEELFKNVEDIWEQYYSHPFISEIKDGVLPVEKFRFYIIQDYLYLLDYAKVFSLGVVKSPTEELMKRFSNLCDGILNSEMGIHKIYMERLNLSVEEIMRNRPALANTSYTNYMLSVSFLGGIKEICVATLACMWSYEVIAQTIIKTAKVKDNFYYDWINAYADSEYNILNGWIYDLTNEMAKTISEDEKNHLIEIFRNCSLYELKFWDMAYNMK